MCRGLDSRGGAGAREMKELAASKFVYERVESLQLFVGEGDIYRGDLLLGTELRFDLTVPAKKKV
jgi:hypothetical protein